MNLNTSSIVKIREGVGELEFPQALKRDLLTTSIYCQSLHFSENYLAVNEGFFVVCDASYFIKSNGEVSKNILAMFQNKATTNTLHFSEHRYGITTPQERLQIEIVNTHGERQKVSALAVLGLVGPVANYLLTI